MNVLLTIYVKAPTPPLPPQKKMVCVLPRPIMINLDQLMSFNFVGELELCLETMTVHKNWVPLVVPSIFRTPLRRTAQHLAMLGLHPGH